MIDCVVVALVTPICEAESDPSERVMDLKSTKALCLRVKQQGRRNQPKVFTAMNRQGAIKLGASDEFPFYVVNLSENIRKFSVARLTEWFDMPGGCALDFMYGNAFAAQANAAIVKAFPCDSSTREFLPPSRAS